MGPIKGNHYRVVLDELLSEALQSQADQIVMISRSARGNLYFLSKGRVKKGMPCTADDWNQILAELSKSPATQSGGRSFSLQVKGNTDCQSLIIEEKK